jgi:hypothetical protein
MPPRDPIGKLAALIGSLAVAFMVPVLYAQGQLGRGTSYLVLIADRLGLLAEPLPSAPTEVRASPLMTLSDETIVLLAFWFSGYLGVVAMALALCADIRGEERTYLTAGFMSGAMALIFANHKIGLVTLAAGVAVVLVFRCISSRRKNGH